MEKYLYKVSVIIPVYNAGAYLRKCLDSLVNQTLDSLQLIVILDCPTDGSDSIVREYAKRYPNIFVIENKINLHVGESRNEGLEVVKGKYVGFFDHDDFGECDMYEKLYNLAEQDHSDIVLSPFVAIDDDGRILNKYDYPDSDIFTGEDLYKANISALNSDDLNKKFLSAPKTIWNKLYKYDIIRNNNLYFVDTKKVAPEDTGFNIKYLSFCGRVSVCRQSLYYHVFHNHNTGNSVEYKSLRKYVSALSDIYSFLESRGDMNDEDVRSRFQNAVRLNVYNSFVNELRVNGIVKAINNLKTIAKEYGFVKAAYNRTSRIDFINGYNCKANCLSFVMSKII